jgi:sulfite reductase (NADPH) flavoprotein alpha-component
MIEIHRLVWALILLSAYTLFCWLFLHYKPKNLGKGQGVAVSTKSTEHTQTLCYFLIAYASQSGTAAALARQSAALFKGNCDSKVLPLNQVDEQVLARAKEALFVVSTYGEGVAPDNANLFVERYLTGVIELDLSHLRFSVIALGDRVYQQFCAFGHQLYQGLLKLGATARFEPIELCASQSNAAAQALNLWRDSLALTIGNSNSFSHLQQPLIQSNATANTLSSWQLTKRQLLNPGSPGAGVYLVTLTPVKDTSVQWCAGDLVELRLGALELSQLGQAHNDGAEIRRKYSIASIAEQGVIELVVRQHLGPDGRFGLGSGWLTNIAKINTHFNLQLIENAAFHGIENTRPMILIGSGTGIAGLRAHIKMRHKQQAKHTWLLFGERTAKFDNLFADEILNWQQNKTLLQVDLSFSRDNSQAPYIQDVLWQKAQQVREWVMDGAAIYVCGNRLGMAQGVEQCLQQILDQQDYQQLLIEGRYRRDVY